MSVDKGYTEWPPVSWETEVSANSNVGRVASGHASITGTGNVTTGLANLIQSCTASLQATSFGAGGAWAVSIVPTATPGQVAITVKDSAGNASTTPVVVHWFASDEE